MNSRERLETSLNHKEPDKIPFDLGGSCVTGITITALKKYLEFKGNDNVTVATRHLTQQLGVVPEALLENLSVDVRGVWPNPPTSWVLDIKEDEQYQYFTNEWGIGWKMPKIGGMYYDMQVNPLAGIDTVEGLIKYPWPDPDDPSRYAGMREKAKEIYGRGYAVTVGNISAGLSELPGWLRGYENWYCDLALDPEYANTLLDITTEIQYRYIDRMLDEIGDLVTVYVDTQDAGSQTGTLLSPEMFRQFIKPRLKKVYELVKKKSKAKVFVHSCGSVYDLIPDFIDTGVDILNPVQISAAKMDPESLKREFGKDIVFWGGGVETQRILPGGTPEQVKENVERLIDKLAPGGGFVFSAIHNIQGDVPPQNLEAMFEAFESKRSY